MTFLLPEVKRQHLKVVENAFKWLNIKELDNAKNWENGGQDTLHWDICWSWGYTEFAKLGRLEDQHRVNHLPGSYVLVTKDHIHKTLSDLQRVYGYSNFDFVPKQFLLPSEEVLFKKAYDASLKHVASYKKVKMDRAYGRRWLVKSQGHRGVRMLNNLDELPALRQENVLLSQCIEPYLVDGRKFDLGVYVAVTSILPLRIYVYDNILLRFCKQRYPRPLSADSPKESYVVVDYIPPWHIPDLSPSYSTLPSASHEGTNHWDALLDYMEKMDGIDRHFVKSAVHDSIAKLIVANRGHFMESIDELKKAHSKSNFQAHNFFELWRFDFMLDDNGKPWLLEVNQSPNLKAKEFFSPSFTTDERLKQNVVYDLLSMISHQGNTAVVDDAILETTPLSYCKMYCYDNIKNAWNTACWSCNGWYTKQERQILYQAVLEHANRGHYTLVYPPVYPQSSSIHTYMGNRTALDTYLSRYFESLHMEQTKLDTRETFLCVSRLQCSNHGDCVNGNCKCDGNYEGNTCFIRKGTLQYSTDTISSNWHLYDQEQYLTGTENTKPSSSISTFGSILVLSIIVLYFYFTKYHKMRKTPKQKY